MNIIEVTAESVGKLGFFCQMSRRKSEGYKIKENWLKNRFGEGLRLKMLDLKQGGRGFIEYIPGEYAWRAVNAEGYLFIHCIWVVGQCKGKGYGKILLDECLEDAKQLGFRGVAVVCGDESSIAKKEFFLHHDFEIVDTAPFHFQLLAKTFSEGIKPSFPINWTERSEKYPDGLTIFCTGQCPYIFDAITSVTAEAAKRNIQTRIVELETARQVHEMSPSPYGIFNAVYNGKLIFNHFPFSKELFKRLDQHIG